MGKIFGISDLPASIIGKTIQPQNLVPKPVWTFIRKIKVNNFLRTPIRDTYCKPHHRPHRPNTMQK